MLSFERVLLVSVLSVLVYQYRRLFNSLKCARAGNAAAGTSHALEQVAIVLARLSQSEQLTAVAQTLRRLYLYLALGGELRDNV